MNDVTGRTKPLICSSSMLRALLSAYRDEMAKPVDDTPDHSAVAEFQNQSTVPLLKGFDLIGKAPGAAQSEMRIDPAEDQTVDR